MSSFGNDFIWAAFQPFGRNMWSDVPVKRWGSIQGNAPERLLEVCAADHLRFDETVWRRVVDRMALRGINTIVLDVGEALREDFIKSYSMKS